MNSNARHSPVFLIFPPEVAVPDYQATEFTATTYGSESPVQKFLATKMKVIGFINSGAFLIALKRKLTETLMKLSQLMNFLSALAATGGIILLVFSFLLDRNYICGYSQKSNPCNAVTILFLGILVMLIVFSIIELFISLPYSILGCHSEDYEECC
uniref:Membrane-spanning 4-domains, subfamily A, member 5 n=1 Tax=Jaculus jaculus TaxID=51337 RepID=A0A8C5KN94_JACJA